MCECGMCKPHPTNFLDKYCPTCGTVWTRTMMGWRKTDRSLRISEHVVVSYSTNGDATVAVRGL